MRWLCPRAESLFTLIEIFLCPFIIDLCWERMTSRTDVGHAPSRMRAFATVDGGPVPLGPTAAHEPAEIPRALWARWRSLGATSDQKMRVSA